MGTTPNARPNHQIHFQESTQSDIGTSPCDELWQLWSRTESVDRVLKRFGQMLREVEYWERSEMLSLVSLWRHISCSAEVLREDHEIELFNTFGSPDLAEARF